MKEEREKARNLMSEKLSEHFTVEEFIYSDTAKRKGISNNLTPEHLANAKVLCKECLEPVRKLLGKPMKVTSGYRSKALNQAVKGSKTSHHCMGCALDFQVAGMTPEQIVSIIRKSGIKFTQLIEEHSGSSNWTHISYVKGNLKCEVLRYKNGKYTKI